MLGIPEHIIKFVSYAGGLLAKAIAVGLTAFGLKEIWQHNKKKELSFDLKLEISILYILHAGALALAFAVLMGVEIVSLPVATAIVSGTALLKNAYDWVKDNHRAYKLNKELKSKQTQFDLENALFKKNLDNFNKQHESLFSNPFQYLENKFYKITSFFRKFTFKVTKNPAEQLKQMNEISAALNENRDANPEDVGVLAKDLEKIVTTATKITELQNEVALANLDAKNRRFSTQISGATASVALLLCFPSNWLAASMLNPIMLVIGIASALTSVWGIYKKHLAVDNIRASENKQIHALISDSVVAVDKIQKPTERTALTEKLDNILVESERNKSPRERVIPVIFRENPNTVSPSLSHMVRAKRAASASELEVRPAKRPYFGWLSLSKSI